MLWLAANAGWIMLVAVLFIVGCALGYFTCATDLVAEKKTAYNEGYRQALDDVADADQSQWFAAGRLQAELEASRARARAAEKGKS